MKGNESGMKGVRNERGQGELFFLQDYFKSNHPDPFSPFL